MLHCLRSRYFPRGSLICKVLEKENFSGSSYKSLSLSSIALWVGATALTEADKSEIEENCWSIVPFDARRRSFFKYEKRIRQMSTRDKVFEYFASFKSHRGHKFMSPSDVMRSLVPVYPQTLVENSRAIPVKDMCLPVDKESLLCSQECFSFHEWLLIEALLSVPEDEINVAFAMLDCDENGEIDKNEFLQLVTSFIKNERIVSASASRPQTENIFSSKFMKILFGEDLRETLTLESLEHFVKRLRSDIINLEFEHYDIDKKGEISGECLALSIACHAQIERVDDLFKRVSSMQDRLKQASIGCAQYEEYIRVIRSMKSIIVGIEFYKKNFGRPDLDGFKRVLDRVGVSCTFPLSEIIFYLFSDNGEINTRELGNTMMTHISSNFRRSVSYTENGMLECLKTCFIIRHRG